jgi:hypothetical protein
MVQEATWAGLTMYQVWQLITWGAVSLVWFYAVWGYIWFRWPPPAPPPDHEQVPGRAQDAP